MDEFLCWRWFQARPGAQSRIGANGDLKKTAGFSAGCPKPLRAMCKTVHAFVQNLHKISYKKYTRCGARGRKDKPFRTIAFWPDFGNV